MKKILLAFPIFYAVYPRPFERFMQILICAGRQMGYLFGPLVIERKGLVEAMNQVGDRMRSEDWDAVIVFDDDCLPPYDVIPRLLARCFDEGHLFVAAAGVMRGFPFTTTAARYYPEGISGEIGPSGKVERLAGFYWLDDLANELTDVDFCGVPAAIIHRQCFEVVDPPFFGNTDERGAMMTHDAYFCRKLKDKGIQVLVDGTLRCGHLIEAPVVDFDNRRMARGEVA